MIEAIETHLPEARQLEINQWLNRVETAEFLGSLKAEIAVLLAMATRKALENPHHLLSYPQHINLDSEELLRKAARLQMCIDVFEEKRAGDAQMISVTLKTS